MLFSLPNTTKNSPNFRALFFSLLTVLTLYLNLKIVDENKGAFFHLLFKSIKGYDIIEVLLFLLLYQFYKHSSHIYDNTKYTCIEKLCMYIPAALFSFFMIFGYSFQTDNSWNLVLSSSVQMVKSFIAFSGYFVLFLQCIIELFYFLDRADICSVKAAVTSTKKKENLLESFPACMFSWYCKRLKERPFVTVLITFIILYIPYMIASYPAIFMGDTSWQIPQAFNLKEYSSTYLNLISEDVRLNNHHPVFHTLLEHGAILIGVRVFSSWNIGAFLFALLQFLILAIMLSLFIKTLIRLNVNLKVVIPLMLYFLFAPRNQNYMFLLTKDVWFTAILIMFLLLCSKWISGNSSIKLYIALFSTLLGIILFRNDGKYLVFLMLLGILFFYPRKRKAVLCLLITTMGFSLLYNGFLLPAFKITPSSRREMLSIPFQQTARYVRDAHEEVTEEEEAAISAVLDFDSIADKYDPRKSDAVKATFNESATTNDMKQYFTIWYQMLKKHPGIYIQATMNNIYSYFYPAARYATVFSYSWSTKCMQKTNTTCESLGADFYYPELLSKYRNSYESMRESIFKLPLLSVLLIPATYVWILILWTFYCIKRKCRKGFTLTIPLLIQLLICMAGPCNGWYFRYLYPIAVCLPVVITLGLHDMNHNNKLDRGDNHE